MNSTLTFLLTTDTGVEKIVLQEISNKFPYAVAQRFENLSSRLLVKNVSFEDLMTLRSFHNIIEIGGFLYLEDISIASIVKITENIEIKGFEDCEVFRVTAQRFGNQDFTSVEIQKAVGQVLVNRFAKKVNLEQFDYNFRIDLIGNFLFWGRQLTENLSEKRLNKPFHHRAAIRQTLANVLIQLAEIQSGMKILDCTCGGGTILLEAATIFGDSIEIFGSDLHDEYLAGAKLNIETNHFDYVKIKHCDARELSKVYTEKFDRVISNLPFGMVSGKNMDLRSFYHRLLNQLDVILEKNGQAILLTARPGLFREINIMSKLLYIVEEIVVESSGLFPHIFILQKVCKV